MTALRRKFSLILTLVAWLFASGSQWDIVQAFAWARMFAENARVLPLPAALALTFSPEGRCGLCGAVSTAKAQQDERGPGVASASFEGKLLLAFAPTPVVLVAPPRLTAWPAAGPVPRSATRARPPVPPPRG